MEVDQWLCSDLSLNIALGLGFGHLLRGSIERGDIGVVMLGVVEFHDLAADGRLERAIVVCKGARSVLEQI